MDMNASLLIAASGMRAQSNRMRIIAENIANANSTAQTPGADPYRRKVATVTSNFDRDLGATLVEAGKPMQDMSAFRSQYDPGNPAADKQGYVKMPNVNQLVEVMDMREAQNSYEADLNVMQTTKSMLSGVINLLKR
jgi:flagellar basal-body rod protein FlgC